VDYSSNRNNTSDLGEETNFLEKTKPWRNL